ncbi:MAG: type II toxin-antitoxin system prevent-host-death family antitoxin, partial [Actinobacteria bacterium]|nr:type II toxin-antitoxin system prevent-host-death family antitoxin [Actinomycetota bacterium]
MERVGVRELKQNASRVLDRVKAGETVEITEHGHPVALLTPLQAGDDFDRLVAAGPDFRERRALRVGHRRAADRLQPNHPRAIHRRLALGVADEAEHAVAAAAHRQAQRVDDDRRHRPLALGLADQQVRP